MGNNCCSESGHTEVTTLEGNEDDDGAYVVGQKPVQDLSVLRTSQNQEFKNDQYYNLKEYSSDQQLISLESNLRGEQTKKELDEDLYIKLQEGTVKFQDDSYIQGHNLNCKDTKYKKGYGTIKLQDGTIYEGFWENDMYNGRGKIQHVNGNTYEGQFKDGYAQGFGVYKHINGCKYVGYWKLDRENGFGKEEWKDGSKYAGFFQNGAKHGQGQYQWTGGNEYIGEWKNNIMSGKGYFKIVQDDIEDKIYIGDWLENKMHGEGTFKWADGRIYMGQFQDDKKWGVGIYLWKDGRAYNGSWLNGKQHGLGYFIAVDQQTNEISIKKGNWFNGKRYSWDQDITDQEIAEQQLKYKLIQQRSKTVLQDIFQIQQAMKQVSTMQLGFQTSDDPQDIQDDQEPLEKLLYDTLKQDKKQSI